MTCVEKWPQVWIISRDGDYCHKYAETVVLNAALFHDLTQKRQDIVVHCFTEMEKGLRDFINASPVLNAQLPTPDEAERINKEQEALPPRSWMDSDDGAWYLAVQQNAARQRSLRAAITARNATMYSDEDVLPTPPLGPVE